MGKKVLQSFELFVHLTIYKVSEDKEKSRGRAEQTNKTTLRWVMKEEEKECIKTRRQKK